MIATLMSESSDREDRELGRAHGGDRFNGDNPVVF